MSIFLQLAIAGLVSWTIAVLGSFAMIRLAKRYNWVDQPRTDRWHQKATPTFGGAPIFLAFIAGIVPFLDFFNVQNIAMLVGAFLMFVTGLLDDVVKIKPSSKLLAQMVSTALMMLCGVWALSTWSAWIALPVTFIWFIGITNALNLLDGMDGLAAGIAAISCLGIVVVSMSNASYPVAIMAISLAAANLGFLIFNFHPARIFMGDSGSLFIGFTLASISVLGTWEHASNLFMVMAVPVLLLIVPIFDTTLVTVLRKLHGHSVVEGGQDHTFHRLAKLGLKDVHVVLLLWSVSGIFGAVVLVGVYMNVLLSVVMGGFAICLMLALGIYLGMYSKYRYPESKTVSGKARTQSWIVLFLRSIPNKKQWTEVFGDAALVSLAMMTAFLTRYEADVWTYEWQLKEFLPLAIALKLMAFYLCGLYRLVWRYVSLTDLLLIGKSIALSSSLLSVAAIMLFGLEYISLSILFLDAVFTFGFVTFLRLVFRFLREWLELSLSEKKDGTRILILGAGDLGERLVREINHGRHRGQNVIGFLDDSMENIGRSIHGKKILGPVSNLRQAVLEHRITEIYCTETRLHDEKTKYFRDLCEELDVPIYQAKEQDKEFALIFTPLALG